MEESRLSQWSVIRSILAILQWWGFNVTVIIMNKWIFQWLVWSKHFDWRIWASLVPIVGGILLTSMTELSFNMFGFCAALFGCLATSMKTILAESLLHGYKFDRNSDGFDCCLTTEEVVSLFPTQHQVTIDRSKSCRLLQPICFALSIRSVYLLCILSGYTASYGAWAEFCLLFLIGTVDSDIWPSINTVYYMAPYATMILAGPALLLEGPGVVQWFQTHTSLLSALTIIFGSGVLAFCLNFSIFYVIHSTTAVTFNVAGNLKVRWTVITFNVAGNLKQPPKLQNVTRKSKSSSETVMLDEVAVAVTCSWLIFRNPISAMNAVGCAVTLVGCTFYGYVRHLLSQQPPGTPRTPRTPRNLKELIPLVSDKLDDKV
ncbi:hypothetical protein C3L33_11342, partial [Rhododendron williamsianum]